MLWYLKSKIFIESVVGHVCEADKFILHQIETPVVGNRSRTIYQVVDEYQPKAFSSFKSLMLEFLQPSSFQLLANLNECLRRCFDPSNTTLNRLARTVLRDSQSSYDSSEEDSPRMAPRVARTEFSPASTSQAAPAVEVDLNHTLSTPAFPQVLHSAQAHSSATLAAQDVLSSCCNVSSTALCLLHYTAVACQQSWWSRKPSMVPHCLRLRNGLENFSSDVQRILQVDHCYEYIFFPALVLPISCAGSEVSFPKVSMELTDRTGKVLDARELDNHNVNVMNFNMTSSSAANKSSRKGSVFRNSGYSIRVWQYFFQVTFDALAHAGQWWYLSDSGRFAASAFLFSFCAILTLSFSCAVMCYRTHRSSVKS
jgi:hypothetical protein